MAAIYPDRAGKVVLVTGGASGIGSAIVRGFARQKSTVVFFDLKDEAGIGLSRELSGQRLAAYFQHVDLTDIAALAEVRVLSDWCPPFLGYQLYYPAAASPRLDRPSR